MREVVLGLEKVTFTFAIVNWNTRDLLDDCLASILREKGDWSIQILVADNASSDGSAEMMAEKYPEVQLVRNPDNVGFAKGHASLLPYSRGSYHILVNSDVRILPGCLNTIARRLETDPQIGILGTKIIGPDDRVQPSCRRFPNLVRQVIEASGLGRLLPRSRIWNGYKMGDFDHDHSREVDQVMGSFFVIRTSLIEAIGFLDQAFFMYYEEVDYCLRCRAAGYKVFFEAEAAIWHQGGGSSRKVKVLTIRRTFRSMRHFYQKHWGPWVTFPLALIVSLDLVTHWAHALVTRQQPGATLKAYALGWWDVVLRRRADL